MNKKYFHLALLLICFPLVLIAQKEINKNFPKDLQEYELLVERIPLSFLNSEFNKRDSKSIALEFNKISYIQDLYLVRQPVFPCLLIDREEIDSLTNSFPDKYKYVLKFKIKEKKINKVKEEVISFYFRNAKQGADFKLLDDYYYDTKESLVIIYARIKKAYSIAKK